MKYTFIVYFLCVNWIFGDDSLGQINMTAALVRTLNQKSDKNELENAMFSACELKKTEWVDRFISLGASPNATRVSGKFGRTPLEIATNLRDKNTIKVLLDRGAIQNIWRPIHISAILNDTVELSKQIDKNDIDVLDKKGWTALTYAFDFKNVEALKLLIQHGAKHGFNEMQMCAVVDDMVMAKQLIEKDSSMINRRESIVDYTPLMLATLFGHSGMAQFLIDQGAEIESQAASRGTALIIAVENGNLECVRLLLRSGADANHVMGGKFSALAYAVILRDVKVVQMLIQAGANPDLSLGDRTSAKDFALKHGNDEILKLLEH